MYRCECGEESEERLIECDFCKGRFCESCFDSARVEVGGGINVKDIGLNCCYGCAEEPRIQLEILQEQCGLAAGKCARTGNHKDLREYLKLRHRVFEMTETIGIEAAARNICSPKS